MYRRLLAFLRPHGWRMAGNIAANIIAAALDGLSFLLLIPFLDELFASKQAIPDLGFLGAILYKVIGQFIAGRSKMDALSLIIVAIGVIVVVKNVFVWIAGQLGASLQEYVTRDLRDAVFRHVQRLPLRYFHHTKTGQIIAKIVTDTDQTKSLITELVTRSIQNAAKIVVTIVILVRMSPKLAALSLIAAPLLTAALQPILRRLREGHRGLRQDYGEMTSILQEVVSGIRLVKSFRGERAEDHRFVDASDRYSQGMVRMNRVAVLSQPLTEIIGTSIAMMILWIGAHIVMTNSRGMDAASLIVFMTYVMTLLPPLKQLSQAPTTAQQALAASERLFEVLDRPTEDEIDRATRTVAAFNGTIEFDNVSFAYESERVLDSIDFTASKGQVIALVGPSGAGKSTLVDLIPRFYEPTSGCILIDGIDAREITLSSLRALTGIVSQDTVLFNDTVRNNIAYGAADRFSDAEIERAARAANAHDFIAALPNGYETVLGERGTRLSGGQRQRLAIARALLVDPPILIFDEATSALDTESERLVQEAIDRLLAGRTVFVIAHRLSTIVHADAILVLDGGRIVERGTHTELLAERGTYHRLHSLQVRDEHVAAERLMRILIYVSTEEWTATSRTLLTAARGLMARGHTVTVACCNGSRLETLSREAGIETDVIDGAWFGAGGAWDLRKVLQTRFIEVAIVCSERDHRTVASAMRFAERGSVLRRIPPFEPVDFSDTGKLSLKLAPSGLLLASETEVPEAQPPGWTLPSTVAPIGIDPTAYDTIEPIIRADIGAPPQGLLIACDYHPSGRNRIGDLFRALALLAPRHAHLHAVIFGPGSADDDVRLHASALGVGRVVSFLGERPDNHRLMRAADTGWVVAGGDAGAYSCLEFMALRVPVIAERWPLAQHFVADNITGVLLSPGDPPHTASVVADFLSREEKRVAMGNAGRVRVARDFPESAMIDGFEKAVTAAGNRTAWQPT